MSVDDHLAACRRERRDFLRKVTWGAAWAGMLTRVPGLFAEELAATATMTEGPFYPDKLPLDTDNDLLVLNDSLSPAVGEVTHLSGRILNVHGEPMRNAFVEIWQVDSQGAYLHRRSANGDRRDVHFQGYGRFLTDSSGHYYFRTIKPVSYPGRAPHIHFGISRHGRRIFTTQLLIKDHPDNEQDGVFLAVKDPKDRQTVLAEFRPVPQSTVGELSAEFDIVMGITAEETDNGEWRAGIGPPDRQRPRRGSSG